MNDMPIFQPSPMFNDDKPDAAPQKRNRRKPRQAQPEVEKPPGPKKPVNKPRREKVSTDSVRGRLTKKAKAGKLGINEIVSATVGLKEDQATVLLNIVESLEHLKKSAKSKVIEALAKLFS